jgi:dolichyl-phosphate-mannose-protein mannosyltransferase
VVFDEAPYQQYISHYFTGTYYFNLHPPAGKLILAAGAWLLDVPAAVLAQPAPAVALRIVPAVAGALVVPVFWLLLRQLGAARRIAFLGALLLALDNALVAISRFVLIDSFLLLFILSAVTTWLAARRRTGRARWAWLSASALLCGLAASTKWTGLAALGIVAVMWLRDAWTPRAMEAASDARRGAGTPARWLQNAGEAAVLSVVPAAVYVATFAVHFALLPRTGPDAATMSPAFRETLAGSKTYRDGARMSLASRIADLHRAMQAGNAAYVTSTHASASPWWSWPILKHPIYAWQGDSVTATRSGHVLIEGNLVVWWATLVGMAVVALAMRRGGAVRARLKPHREALALLGAAWLLNFLPFAFISRILFLYSYFPAFVFSVGFAALGAGALAGWTDAAAAPWWRFPSRRSAALYWGVAALAAANFVFFAPLTYGAPISDSAFRARTWVLERHILQ